MYSRRPTSMPTTVSAGRVVQRGCEPRAINPLQGEKRERGRFLVTRDIGTKRDLFNNPPGGPRTLLFNRCRSNYSLRRWGAALAPRARQVPAKPSAKVSRVAIPAVHNSGTGRNTHSIFISRVTRR